MKQLSRLTSLLPLLASILFTGGPALAQDFLSPVTPSAPLFNSNGALNSGGAVGNLNNSSNLLTGPGAFNAGVPGGNSYSLPTAGNGLLAPNSVNTSPFPSGTYSYGFSQPNSGITITPGAGPNQYGMYAGQMLPTVATSSVDINTVDCPYLRESYGPGAQVVNPFQININLPGLGNINLSESAASATSFLQDEFNSLGGSLFGN